MLRCRGWKAAHECDELEHLYWEYEGACYWPTELDLCPACADMAQSFLFEEERGPRGHVVYSRSTDLVGFYWTGTDYVCYDSSCGRGEV